MSRPSRGSSALELRDRVSTPEVDLSSVGKWTKVGSVEGWKVARSSLSWHSRTAAKQRAPHRAARGQPGRGVKRPTGRLALQSGSTESSPVRPVPAAAATGSDSEDERTGNRGNCKSTGSSERMQQLGQPDSRKTAFRKPTRVPGQVGGCGHLQLTGKDEGRTLRVTVSC